MTRCIFVLFVNNHTSVQEKKCLNLPNSNNFLHTL
uniref:Uncharacterized protein n=1 Tax=Anguilla anguilla TaxID=7936 RepID=A0A0E9SK14_ANGAN